MTRQLSSQESIENLMANSHDTADALVMMTHPPSRGLAQKCVTCCFRPVALTAPEALYIARFVLENFDQESLEYLQLKLEERCNHNEQQATEKTGYKAGPCAFLNEAGQCSIYEVRPISCRTWACHSQESCDFPMEEAQTPQRDDKLQNLGQQIITRLRQSLEAHDLDAREYELHSVIRRALMTEFGELLLFKEVDIFINCKSVD